MNLSPAASERITAIVSTLVAVAILAGGVTAFQSRTTPIDDIVQLESDLRFQLEVAFRHDPNDRAARLAQLEQVTQAWQQSPRTAADREKLANWLLAATIRSMPGSLNELPAVPVFSQQPTEPIAQQTPHVVVEPASGEEHQEPPTQIPSPVALISTDVLPVEADPFVGAELEAEDLPMPSTIEPVATLPAIVPPTTTLTTTAPVVEPVTPVRINLTELAARVAGYHDGLDELDAEVLKLKADDFTAMGELLDQLAELAYDFRFVRLYYEALTPRERRTITAPRPLTVALTQLERRLDRSEAVRSSDFLDEFDADNQDRIRELRKRLTEITARLEW